MAVFDRFDLSGKTALVTGAGSGIGRGMTLALAEAGADIAVADRNEDGARETCLQVEATGRACLPIVADVTDKRQVEGMVEAALERWNRLDVGVNCAGIGRRDRTEEMEEESWDAVLEVDLKGAFLCCQAQGRAMLQRGGGVIVNVASMSARVANRPQTHTHYSAAKAGVVQMTRVLAAEWASRNIRVNSISPGYTRTPMTAHVGEELTEVWVEQTPMARMGTPADYQGAVLFLASDASAFMTGQDLVIDGGYTLW